MTDKPKEEISEQDYIMFGNCAGCRYHSRTYDGGICHVLDVGCILNITIDKINIKDKIKKLAEEFKDLVDKERKIKKVKFVHTDYSGNPIQEK